MKRWHRVQDILDVKVVDTSDNIFAIADLMTNDPWQEENPHYWENAMPPLRQRRRGNEELACRFCCWVVQCASDMDCFNTVGG